MDIQTDKRLRGHITNGEFKAVWESTLEEEIVVEFTEDQISFFIALINHVFYGDPYKSLRVKINNLIKILGSGNDAYGSLNSNINDEIRSGLKTVAERLEQFKEKK